MESIAQRLEMTLSPASEPTPRYSPTESSVLYHQSLIMNYSNPRVGPESMKPIWQSNVGSSRSPTLPAASSSDDASTPLAVSQQYVGPHQNVIDLDSCNKSAWVQTMINQRKDDVKDCQRWIDESRYTIKGYQRRLKATRQDIRNLEKDKKRLIRKEREAERKSLEKDVCHLDESTAPERPDSLVKRIFCRLGLSSNPKSPEKAELKTAKMQSKGISNHNNTSNDFRNTDLLYFEKSASFDSHHSRETLQDRHPHCASPLKVPHRRMSRKELCVPSVSLKCCELGSDCIWNAETIDLPLLHMRD